MPKQTELKKLFAKVPVSVLLALLFTVKHCTVN